LSIINSVVKWVGEKASLINVILVGLIVIDVFLRYVFSNTKNWVLELEWHLYALIFLLGISYALQKDEHVRVDLFYQKYSPRTRAIVNLLGHLIFLVPWCIVVISTSYKYAANSFSFSEGSPNPGGLPMRYIIKSSIFIGFGLLLLQGVAQIMAYIKIILKR
jgi:TRAP-type mannitol/chloroaromatic compound transport system permease small subunit